MTHSNLPHIASLSDFSADSRVWVYISDRALSDAESADAQRQLDSFCRQWTAHNQALKAVGEIFENQFLFLMVDESQAGASGCSIDKSVHFLEKLGDSLQVDFFERMRFAWIDAQNRLSFGSRAELIAAVKENRVTADTLMANSMVQSKRELLEKWLLPFGKSWHKRIAAAHA